jgi:hypothetical protein
MRLEAHDIGVQTMAQWTSIDPLTWGVTNNSVQYYSCPADCEALHRANESSAYAPHGTTQWSTCGVSSAVAVAAQVNGHKVYIRAHEVQVDGTQYDLKIGDKITSPGVYIERVSDPHPVEEPDTPGKLNSQVHKDKIKISIHGVHHSYAARIETWQFDQLYAKSALPTGYLTNIKLTIPGDAVVEAGSACSGDDNNNDEVSKSTLNNVQYNQIQQSPAWPAAELDDLDGVCTSFTGEYKVVESADSLCSSTGITMDNAGLACAQFAAVDKDKFINGTWHSTPAVFEIGDGTAYEACMMDVCALGGIGLSSAQVATMHAKLQADVLALPPSLSK